jgi:hypothetical protein
MHFHAPQHILLIYILFIHFYEFRLWKKCKFLSFHLFIHKKNIVKCKSLLSGHSTKVIQTITKANDGFKYFKREGSVAFFSGIKI